ncbi:TetR/AcrR family transcriptional regulator [Brachybacterium nesterenkovii]|uniref:TetR/AcrR family transcriptional regulator n=1 Tax=Brachybacterium nesterenkovii TaxID=47847 RepID=UPI0032192C02
MREQAQTRSPSTGHGPSESSLSSSSPPRGRRERAKADKRARILAAARELFRDRGYEGTSMGEVARRADVAAGTVFQYAATKTELLMMVTASLWPALAVAGEGDRTETAGSAEDTGSGERILGLIDPFLDVVRSYPEQTTWVAREILFGDHGPHRAEVLARVEELETTIAGHLAQAPRPGGDDEHALATHPTAMLGARLLVTGVLAEVNRARQGRTQAGELTDRVRRIVALVHHGVEDVRARTAPPPA